MKSDTVDYLIENDREALEGIVGHNEQGESKCKWSAPGER